MILTCKLHWTSSSCSLEYMVKERRKWMKQSELLWWCTQILESRLVLLWCFSLAGRYSCDDTPCEGILVEISSRHTWMMKLLSKCLPNFLYQGPHRECFYWCWHQCESSKYVRDLEKGDWPEASSCHRPPSDHLEALGFSAEGKPIEHGPEIVKHTCWP